MGAQHGQAHPLSPTYVPDPMELDEHVPLYVPDHLEYHDSSENIPVEDQSDAEDANSHGFLADSDSMEDDTDAGSIDYPNEPKDGEDDDEDPEEDPIEEHESEDGEAKEDKPFEDSDKTEPFKEDETAATPPSPKRRGARITVRPQPPIGRFYPDLIDEEESEAVQPCTCLVSILLLEMPSLELSRELKALLVRINGLEKIGISNSTLAGRGRWKFKYRETIVASLHSDVFLEIGLADCHKISCCENAKIDKISVEFPITVNGNVSLQDPRTHDFAIELANDLMDQKLRTYAERQNENKRKAEDSSRNNHQQQSNKRQNVARAYTAGPGVKRWSILGTYLWHQSVITTIRAM
ncbi:hypothetical protein Tco_0313137 [Tanacetum coccineum]